MIEDQVKNPTGILASEVTLIVQDSDKLETDIQRMRLNECNRWVTTVGSMIYFLHVESQYSSTLREILGSLRALQTLVNVRDCKVILPVDSLNTWCTIRWGS